MDELFMNKAALATGLVLLVLMALNVFLRQPVVDDIFCDPDVGGVAYSAQELTAGHNLYDNTVETKPPGSYLLFALLFAFAGLSMVPVYLASMALHCGVLLCLYFIGKEIRDRPTGLLAGFFYALYSVSSSTNGYCPNFETWPILPVALVFYLLFKYREKQRWGVLVSAGFLAGLSLLFKQTIVVFLPAQLVVLFLFIKDSSSPEKSVVRPFLAQSVLFFAGALIPLVAVVVFFAMGGALGGMWRALNPLSNLGYAFSEPFVEVKSRIFQNGGFFIGQNKGLLLFAAFSIFLSRFRTTQDPVKERQGVWLIWVWLVGALVSVCIGTKFFDHYFILLVAPLCLLGAFAVVRIALYSGLGKSFGIGLFIAALLFPFIDMGLETKVAATAISERIKIGRLNWYEESDYFYTNAVVVKYASWNKWLKKTGQCIEQNTMPGQPIYVWDYEPGVYWFAKRRAPTRHFMYFNVAVDLPEGAGRWFAETNEKVNDYRKKLLSDLEKDPPAFIVVLNRPSGNPDQRWDYQTMAAQPFDALQKYMDENYLPSPECSNKYVRALKRINKSEKILDQ